jgi:hypothetical protein
MRPSLALQQHRDEIRRIALSREAFALSAAIEEQGDL